MRIRSCYWSVAVLLLVAVTIPCTVGATEAGTPAFKRSKVQQNFALTVTDGLLSLKARDASLRAIVKEIGARLNIEVVARVPEEETVTKEFSNLPLEEALKRLSTDYVYLRDAQREEGAITKLFILPKGEPGEPMQSAGQATEPVAKEPLVHAERKAKYRSADKDEQRPQPFQFEFDPSQFVPQDK